MNDFPADFEIPALPADPLYYEQLTAAATKFFPSLRDAVVVKELRGLPTISPDGKLLVSESEQIAGLIVVAACGVGGIDRSPGVGRVVTEIVSGHQTWLSPSVLNIDRFGDDYSSDTLLRSRCVDVYAHHYHDIY